MALINSAPDKRTALCSFWCFVAHGAASDYPANAILAPPVPLPYPRRRHPLARPRMLA